MLTKEHGIAEFKRGKIFPDRLNKTDHAHYLDYAEKMLRVYLKGAGKTRGELHRAVRKIFQDEPDCPPRRIDGFCKLLDDVSNFSRDIKGKASILRKSVFRLSAAYHPLVSSVDRFFEHQEKEVKEKIAKELDKDWEEIDRDFFADVFDSHRLKQFKGYPESRALLSRYNVAQVQVVLYGATDMTIRASKDLKVILKYAKLFKLMHTILHEGQGNYKIYFDGPASLLRDTRRYGVNFAKFLPSLLKCQNWSLYSRIITRRKGFTVSFQLTSEEGLKSYKELEDEFDSLVEQDFAEKWGEEKRDGWTLERESELLHKGQKVFFPDFILRHDDGQVVYLEIVGFWTPEYLEHKIETLKLFKKYPIILAVAESVAPNISELNFEVIHYKTALKLKDVLERLKLLTT
jgi:predicted nuclease of restriction endonuclease-like RecB superfamily